MGVFYEKKNSNKGGTTMKKDDVIPLEKLEENLDLLTGLLRSGTSELITRAVCDPDNL